MNIVNRKFLISASSMLITALLAQASFSQQVVESRQSRNASNADLFFKIQALEQEVMGLRGQVEEQAHQIKKLSKQRREDYIDLDKRISNMSRGSSAPVGSYGASSRSSSVAAPVPSAAVAAPISEGGGDPAMEQGSYQAAYELVKRQNFKEALPAFKDFILLYPNGSYAANAHYWLGELYLYEANLDNAIQEFDTVVQRYPQHRKAPDALYKLGKAHHVRGDPQTARIMLNRVLSDYGRSGSNAVKLARDYINNELGQ
ncbi:MAG: tol-pal system protein YbgF [Pseudomonadales bacterium]